MKRREEKIINQRPTDSVLFSLFEFGHAKRTDGITNKKKGVSGRQEFEKIRLLSWEGEWRKKEKSPSLQKGCNCVHLSRTL